MSFVKVTRITKSEEEWRAQLQAEEFAILRKKATERPGVGEYTNIQPPSGYFACRACMTPLYSATAKFHSGCGWPAFDKCYRGAVRAERDADGRRVEILCAACDGHLGHVFEGEGFTQTNERHCVNSKSVRYVASPAPPEFTAAEGKCV